MPPRFFTVAEANALLPAVRQLIAKMLAARQQVLELHPQLWPAVEKAAMNGGSKAMSEATQQIMIIQDVVHTLNAWGIQVKDINTGLIDFPARYQERTVLLCWQYDEPSVQFWHDVDTGFSGRQRITDWE
jgi:hypothetical protein